MSAVQMGAGAHTATHQSDPATNVEPTLTYLVAHHFMPMFSWRDRKEQLVGWHVNISAFWQGSGGHPPSITTVEPPRANVNVEFNL